MLELLTRLLPAHVLHELGGGRAVDNVRRDREEVDRTNAIVDELRRPARARCGTEPAASPSTVGRLSGTGTGPGRARTRVSEPSARRRRTLTALVLDRQGLRHAVRPSLRARPCRRPRERPARTAR